MLGVKGRRREEWGRGFTIGGDGTVIEKYQSKTRLQVQEGGEMVWED